MDVSRCTDDSPSHAQMIPSLMQSYITGRTRHEKGCKLQKLRQGHARDG